MTSMARVAVVVGPPGPPGPPLAPCSWAPAPKSRASTHAATSSAASRVDSSTYADRRAPPSTRSHSSSAAAPPSAESESPPPPPPPLPFRGGRGVAAMTHSAAQLARALRTSSSRRAASTCSGSGPHSTTACVTICVGRSAPSSASLADRSG